MRPRPLANPLVAGSMHHAPRSMHRLRGAFTLIELLVVIAIIAILAGLTLSTLGYVNKKGAESRAQSEVAALSAAIESFKLDNGFYPTNAAALYTNLCPVAAGSMGNALRLLQFHQLFRAVVDCRRDQHQQLDSELIL